MYCFRKYSNFVVKSEILSFSSMQRTLEGDCFVLLSVLLFFCFFAFLLFESEMRVRSGNLLCLRRIPGISTDQNGPSDCAMFNAVQQLKFNGTTTTKLIRLLLRWIERKCYVYTYNVYGHIYSSNHYNKTVHNTITPALYYPFVVLYLTNVRKSNVYKSFTGS